MEPIEYEAFINNDENDCYDPIETISIYLKNGRRFDFAPTETKTITIRQLNND